MLLPHYMNSGRYIPVNMNIINILYIIRMHLKYKDIFDLHILPNTSLVGS